jgi:hypothetical protein
MCGRCYGIMFSGGASVARRCLISCGLKCRVLIASTIPIYFELKWFLLIVLAPCLWTPSSSICQTRGRKAHLPGTNFGSPVLDQYERGSYAGPRVSRIHKPHNEEHP